MYLLYYYHLYGE